MKIGDTTSKIKTMLKIRLARTGKKGQPRYRIVVVASTKKRDGASVETLGWYNPTTKEQAVKSERVQYWISKGAQPTLAVRELIES